MLSRLINPPILNYVSVGVIGRSAGRHANHRNFPHRLVLFTHRLWNYVNVLNRSMIGNDIVLYLVIPQAFIKHTSVNYGL